MSKRRVAKSRTNFTPSASVRFDKEAERASRIRTTLQTIDEPDEKWGPESTRKMAGLVEELLDACSVPGQKRSTGVEKMQEAVEGRSSIEREEMTDMDSRDTRGAGSIRGNKGHERDISVSADGSREIFDVLKDVPEPVTIQYMQHPTTDRPDSWYVEHFRRLFHNIEAFVRKYFNPPGLPPFESPWHEIPFSAEFVDWASQVAEVDEGDGGWDELLRDGEERTWLVMGVLVRVLRGKIFEEDLFGATEEQKGLLLQIERAFLDGEGFQRTALRSETVRSILGPHPVPPKFYPTLAHLTAQTALLLQPLLHYIHAHLATTTTRPYYQDLHNLISTAAYLSICIRASPTIIYMIDLHPGDPFDPDDHHSFLPDKFNLSKQRVWDAYTHAKHRYDIQRISTSASQDTNPRAKIPPPTHPFSTHKRLTKIAIWPIIRRYKPGRAADDALEETDGRRCPNKVLREKEGFRQILISRGGAVNYFGVERRGRGRGRVSLRRYRRGLWGGGGGKDRGKGKRSVVLGDGGGGRILPVIAMLVKGFMLFSFVLGMLLYVLPLLQDFQPHYRKWLQSGGVWDVGFRDWGWAWWNGVLRKWDWGNEVFRNWDWTGWWRGGT